MLNRRAFVSALGAALGLGRAAGATPQGSAKPRESDLKTVTLIIEGMT